MFAIDSNFKSSKVEVTRIESVRVPACLLEVLYGYSLDGATIRCRPRSLNLSGLWRYLLTYILTY